MRSCSASLAVLAIVAGAKLASIDALAQKTSGSNEAAFDVVSVRANEPADRNRVFTFNPANGRLRAENQTLRFLILMAYGSPFSIPLPEDRLSGGPAWIDSERFTIEASANRPTSARDFGVMLQKVLTERFGLELRKQSRQTPVYVMQLARKDGTPGPQLHPAKGDCESSGRCGIGGGLGRLELAGASMELLAFTLAEPLQRPVVDKTGLTGSFDGTLEYAPSAVEGREFGAPPDAAANATGPSIFTALQEQFGVKLVSQKGRVDTYVVVKATKPGAN
jgi:uncharacterized protein (TIGR03435 family)